MEGGWVKRRDFFAVVCGAVASPLAAQSQQAAKTLQIGFLYPGPRAAAPPRIKAFQTGLQAGGLRVPDQVTIIPSVTDGDATLLAPMAAELVARKVDLIVAISPAA